MTQCLANTTWRGATRIKPPPLLVFEEGNMNSGWRTLGASVIAGLFALAVSAHAWPQSPADGDDFQVTLLGTGSPPPVMNRFGPGVLVLDLRDLRGP